MEVVGMPVQFGDVSHDDTVADGLVQELIRKLLDVPLGMHPFAGAAIAPMSVDALHDELEYAKVTRPVVVDANDDAVGAP